MTNLTTIIQTTNALPKWLQADLRSDHAGELGAVMIYRGILAVSKDTELRHFAAEHLATEESHLRTIEGLLPAAQRTRLQPAWRLAGWLTGALPSLFGPQAVYATIEAVETFVDQHYQEQIERLQGLDDHKNLRDTLRACQEDEVAHRDEAAHLFHGQRTLLIRGWTALVAIGSSWAVGLAKKI